MSGHKLNRIQRKAFVRQLQSIILNQRDSGSKERYSDDERIKASQLLIEFGNNDEVVDTFSKQLQFQDPEDRAVNLAIMELQAQGFRAGLAELHEGEDEN